MNGYWPLSGCIGRQGLNILWCLLFFGSTAARVIATSVTEVNITSCSAVTFSTSASYASTATTTTPTSATFFSFSSVPMIRICWFPLLFWYLCIFFRIILLLLLMQLKNWVFNSLLRLQGCQVQYLSITKLFFIFVLALPLHLLYLRLLNLCCFHDVGHL